MIALVGQIVKLTGMKSQHVASGTTVPSEQTAFLAGAALTRDAAIATKGSKVEIIVVRESNQCKRRKSQELRCRKSLHQLVFICCKN